ncbi:O-antigen ligase family protein [Mycobacterium seoulense]|uniref:O-antigen ligase family protein n=1 Tax=Mycobacterium seoulense TaxID=386911 RepID=UPI003CF36EE0
MFYLRSRHRLAMSGASLALFLFGCFVYGVLSVRLTTEGIMLIAATFCVVVYWVRPEAMAWVALVGAFAALPQGLHVGKVIGPAVVYLYLVAAILAIGYLIPIMKPQFSDYWLPGLFTLVVVISTVTGFENGHDATIVLRESLSMLEIAVGYVLALLVVYGGYIKWSIRVTAGILWFSAGMAVVSSLHAIRLAGRAESLGAATGAGQAVRIILTTQSPATATLSALVAAAIVGRLRAATLLALGPPALIISLLSFSRNTLISMGVAAGVALLISLSASTVRRTAFIGVVCATVIAVTVPGSLFLLQGSDAGAWLADQLTAFNERVLGGVSSSALAVDESALERLREDSLLNRSIAQAPVFGHGLGYAYQPPKGDDEFSAKFYPAYSHNFYLWWLAKAGAVGMAAFALFALTPLVKAVRCRTAAAKVSVAVSAGLLAISVVWPLPEMPSDSFALGIALGSAMGFAGLRDRERDANCAVSPDAPALTAPSGAH